VISKRFLVLVIGLALHACASCAYLREEPAACSPQKLADIEAAYVAEALVACKGKTLATCGAVTAIEAKYAQKREEWIACR
jgi:hypothetical protein